MTSDLAHQRLRFDYAKSTIARLQQVPNSDDAIRVLAAMLADALDNIAALNDENCDDF